MKPTRGEVIQVKRIGWEHVVLVASVAFLVCAVHDDAHTRRGEVDQCILPAVLAGMRTVLGL